MDLFHHFTVWRADGRHLTDERHLAEAISEAAEKTSGEPLHIEAEDKTATFSTFGEYLDDGLDEWQEHAIAADSRLHWVIDVRAVGDPDSTRDTPIRVHCFDGERTWHTDHGSDAEYAADDSRLKPPAAS